MSEVIYVDTNVWISLVKEEKDHLRPISDFSFKLFQSVCDCNFTVLISNFMLQELEHKLSPKEIENMLRPLYSLNKIVHITSSKEDIVFSKKVAHWQDRLHEILAKKGGAKYLVTRNLKDFSNDLVQVVLHIA